MATVKDHQGNTYGNMVEMALAYGLDVDFLKSRRRWTLEDSLANQKVPLTGIERVRKKLKGVR